MLLLLLLLQLHRQLTNFTHRADWSCEKDADEYEIGDEVIRRRSVRLVGGERRARVLRNIELEDVLIESMLILSLV